MKGRRNYLCATRLQNALRADPRIVPVADPGELSALERWSRSTSDGEFDHLPFVPRPETWDLVCSEPGACSTAACGRRCFYQHARERARAAHLVVMNHALLFTLMRLQGIDERFIFDNDFVVCDEAHTLEPVAAAGAGCRLSRASVLRSVHRLYDPSTERGILAARKRSFRTLCRTVHGEVEEFFGAVLAAARQQTPGRTSDGARDLTLIRIRSRLAIENTLDGRLAELEQRTHRLEEASVAFGVFMYFPTLVEVPIANMFLSLGMHRGPLLAYLMADPELSLQSILLISAIIGRAKAWTFVGWVALFSTIAGLVYGAWIDGASLLLIASYLAGFLAVLALGLHLTIRRAAGHTQPAAGD